MASDALSQLLDLARQDTALQLALDGAADASDLQTLAAQLGLSLSEAGAEQWFSNKDAMVSAALSPEELDALSQGLCDPDLAARLGDDQLAAVAGGEAAMIAEPDWGGEALNKLNR